MHIRVRTLPTNLVPKMMELLENPTGADDRLLRLLEGYVHEISHAMLLGIDQFGPGMCDEITELLDMARPYERDAEELAAQAVEVRVLTKIGMLPGTDRAYGLLQVLAFNIDGGTIPFEDRPDAVMESLDDPRVVSASKRVLRYLRKTLDLIPQSEYPR